MKPHALAMPAYIASLVRTPLERMGLDPSDVTDDMIICPLVYEDGTVVSIVVMCTTQRGWFNRIKSVASLSFVELDEHARILKMHFNENMPLPTGPDDLPFIMRFAAKVRATAWALALTGNIGECLSLPGRPAKGLRVV
jgi:hypothetical protein